MKAIHIGGILSVLLLTGCDTINERHLCVSGDSSARTREEVVAVLATVAARLQMTEMSSRSTAPGTVAFYTLTPEGPASKDFFLLELRARAVGDEIAVDLHAPFGPRLRSFEAADALLAPLLVKSFGANLREGTCAADASRMERAASLE